MEYLTVKLMFSLFKIRRLILEPKSLTFVGLRIGRLQDKQPQFLIRILIIFILKP